MIRGCSFFPYFWSAGSAYAGEQDTTTCESRCCLRSAGITQHEPKEVLKRESTIVIHQWRILLRAFQIHTNQSRVSRDEKKATRDCSSLRVHQLEVQGSVQTIFELYSRKNTFF